MKPLAALVLPAIRWDADRGFAPALPAAEAALSLGVGGFILFGGERSAVQRLTRELAEAAPHPLLFAADFERGAGQQVRGLTPLPPAQAVAALGEDAVAEAAAITAREARDVGVNWALAPVVDLDAEPANPIVQTRAFGADPGQVAAAAARWVAACQDGGVLACAKHFPGHGRTTADSHAELPVVAAGREDLEADLLPYRRAIEAGVWSVMTAHVAYPALDPSGAAATFSRPILGGVLREDLGFDGLVVTDALIMEGARAGGGEAAGAVRALQAGCDLLLYPNDLDGVVAALERAAASGDLARDVLDEALARRTVALGRAAAPCALSDAALARDRSAATAMALAAVRWLRGPRPHPPQAVDLVVVDDDAGGPYPVPARSAVAEALAARGVRVERGGEPVVLVFCDVKSWKGRSSLSPDSRRSLAAALARPATTLLFGHPRLAADVPGTGALLCAWSGDAVMQQAAAEALLAG
ncbi:MAG TPA: glycoside hydrolase family 3 N-terminal domain-containing protein [Gemmatimonadales bacterium]|nr:glycoside hydrolase family 3 N-terminal domain-containing protein [Gemmatimonadales bacterium]